MRHTHLPTRAAAAGLAIVIASLAVGCAPRELTGHATVVHAPTTSEPAIGQRIIPDYVSYAAGTQLDRDTVVGMTTDFPADPDWLSISGGDGSDTVIDMTDEGCSLVLSAGRSADLGIQFVGEDATDTIATLVALVGSQTESTVLLLWDGKDGAVTVDALVFQITNDAGEQVVGLARAFGSLDAFLYVELSCDPGVEALLVFASRVAPYVMPSVA